MTSLSWPARDLVSHRVASTPQRTALIDADRDESWTLRELDRRVDAAAAALRDVLETPREARLGFLLDTRPAFATLFFAAMRLGTTVVPLNVREALPELVEKGERTALDAVVCEDDTATDAVALADELGGLPVRSVDDPGSGRVRPIAVSDGAADSPSSSAVEPAELDPDDVQLVMFTSGTSGEPKGVKLTVANLVASATASAFRLGVTREDRWLCCLPMYHMGGLAPVVRSALYGTPVVVQRSFAPQATADVLEAFGITGVSLVPTMCKRLLEDGWRPADSLRFVLLGGAPASTELLERCHEADVPVHPTYGMTETASQIATATPAETRTHEGTAGQPLLGTDVTVVGEDGEPVPTGEVGEFVVAGPTVTPGYLDPDNTAVAFGDRGLHTGDVGYADEERRLWVLNRRSDRIVTGGENVDPGAVADVLRSHPAIGDAAVVGLEDAEWGERVAALVVPDDGPVDLEDVLAHCDDRLAGFKRPKTLGVVDALPRTHSGTVDRERVRTRLLEFGTDVSTRSGSE
ncbi:acyl-CoA synthetase (AMP-forming)/AMP-acid ligase II [Natronococcus occultus SP4]|uniref:Acyl-CoA synthetase (AMP-forming)/AMP-acid ligase II n=1 Tax=Natronococcus occultus SP4 TaxID=694430 RepID=L0JXI2_9EURY|nr:acyl-CoA synthetase (AMP-forming)/AMP-acid ligase II [Natronococcus occultus SP4]